MITDAWGNDCLKPGLNPTTVAKPSLLTATLYCPLLFVGAVATLNPLQYSCLENPWTEKPGGLQSMALERVRHD